MQMAQVGSSLAEAADGAGNPVAVWPWGRGVGCGGRDYQSASLLHVSFLPTRGRGRVRFTELAAALGLGLERQPFTEWWEEGLFLLS